MFQAYFEGEKIENVVFNYLTIKTSYNTNLYGNEVLSKAIFENLIDANQRKYYYLLTEHDVTSFETGIGLGLIPRNLRFFNLETKP